MDECTRILARLKGILSNLKKAPKRRYREITIKAKLKEVSDLYNLLIENADDVLEFIRDPIVKEARALVFDIKTFITNTQSYSHPFFSFALTAKVIGRISLLYQTIRNKNLETMAKVDIKLGTSLVSTYDGNPEGLDSFIDSVNLFSELTTQENASATSANQEIARGLVARFVKTRLRGIAHQAAVSCATVDDIINTVKAQCDTKENSDSLSLKLKSIRQKNSISEFCTEVEKMCMLLKNAYIKETIPPPKAQEMATKAGITSLINNMRDNNTKIILKSGTFSTINQAVQKVLENCADQVEKPNIYY